MLLEIISGKKAQYQNLPVKFEYEFYSDSHFVFIEANQLALKRALSNLINNSVDAFGNENGIIKIKLRMDNNENNIKISVIDNGKGMPEAVINKIMNNTSITMGKENGHGIGFMQIWETLQQNQGALFIDSELGVGSIITLSFPKVVSPLWNAQGIDLNHQDTVIILDDDKSIHNAWDIKFKNVLEKAQDITVKHFELADDVLNFVKTLTPEVKNNVFFLSDYELLKQSLNGLDVIKQTEITRSILVTSHYANEDIRKEATKIGTKILPKLLASEVSITISPKAFKFTEAINKKQVDAILLDDDKSFVTCMVDYLFNGQEIDEYYNPDELLQKILQYHPDTKICIDNTFKGYNITGLEIAEKLYVLGYKNLHLLSGTAFNNQSELPDYINVVLKGDIVAMNKMAHMPRKRLPC